MAYSFPGGFRLLAVCAALMVAGGAAVGQTDYSWQVGGGGGSYDDPGAWNPAGPPDPNGRAVFDLGGSYDVTFANDHTINSLSVEQGYVEFCLDGTTYELTREWVWGADEHGSVLIGAQPGMTGLTVMDGSVVSNEFTLGRGSGSDGGLIVATDGRWSAFQHAMAIGDMGGRGTLSVYDGGVVQHGHGFAGWRAIDSIGSIDVEGSGSFWWVTGYFGLGVEGAGQLNVWNDGLAQIGKCVMGGVAGSYGSASIEDFGELHLTGAMETSLVVGLGGEAKVYLQYDGLLTNDGNMCLAEQTGSNGDVYVQETSRLNNAFELIVGKDGNAVLVVETGSTVQTGSCSIAPNAGGQGAATVVGGSSRLISAGQLTVGGAPGAPGGTGRLTVRNGARAEAAQFLVGSGGTVVLDAAQLEPTTTVELAGRLEGDGTVAGQLNNRGGTVAPGGSIGLIVVQGPYTQDAAGTFAVEIAAGGPNDYDRLDATGTVTLDGLLDLSLLGGFTPDPTDTFPILTSATNVSGFFTNAPPGVPFVFADGQFDVLYGPDSVILANFLAPGLFEWNDPAGGTFGDGNNWTPSGGPPGSFDHARFDLAAGPYDVTFAAARANSRLTVDTDDVAFRLNGQTYELAHPYDGDASVEIGRTSGSVGRLAATDGTVISKDVILGKDGGSQGELVVGTGGLWQAPNSLVTVGDAGTGTLVVWGGQVEHATGGAAAGPGSFGRIDVVGMGSRWLVDGQFSVGVGGGGVLDVRDGGLARMGRGVVGESGGGVGTVDINGSDSRWELVDGSDWGLIVGQDGNGLVVVRNGAYAMANGHLRVALNASSDGALRIESGGRVEVGGSLGVANGIDADGIVVVDGPGSELHIQGRGATLPTDVVGMEIGQEWNGSLHISDGGYVYCLYSADIGAWCKGNSAGELIVDGDGSMLHADNRLYVGRHGKGSAIVRNGGTIFVEGANPDANAGRPGQSYVGLQAVGELTVTGEQSSMTANGCLLVGVGTFSNVAPGHGTATVADGAELITYKGQSPTDSGGAVGVYVDGTGIVNVTDPNSIWRMPDGHLTVGWAGDGTLNVRSGGRVECIDAIIARDPNSIGSATVDGNGSAWDVSRRLRVAGMENHAGGLGTLTVSHGGQVNVGATAVAGITDGTGTISVLGAGSQLTVTGRGSDDPNGHAGSYVGMEIGRDGDGRLNVINGGKVSSTYIVTVGAWTTGTGEAIVDGNGSEFTTGAQLEVGRAGHGTLTVRNGGDVYVRRNTLDPNLVNSSGLTIIGGSAPGEVTVTGAGSTLFGEAQIHVGAGGRGDLRVADGGVLTTHAAGSGTGTGGIVGTQASAVGEATITGSGSAWRVPDGTLVVGFFGDGTLRVEDAAAAESVGGIVAREPGSAGTATVTGPASSWKIDGTLSIGGHSAGAGGPGTLHVNDGGLVTAGDALALWPGSSVQLGGGHVAVGAGAPPGDSNTVAVLAGGLLTGTGEVIGEVQNREGTVAPGLSFGTLRIDGDYLQGSQATLAIALDGNDSGAAVTAPYDTLSVTGGLWLAGTLAMEWVQVSGDPNSRFGGSYDLITYGEARTGVFSDLGGGEIDANYVVAIDYDAVVDAVTHAVRITLAEPLGGDCDLDGDVDYDDYVLARDGFGTGPGAMWEDGDSDLNGVCDRLDYLALKRHFGQSVVGEAVVLGGAGSIPAPATLLVLAAAGPVLLRRRSPGRKRAT